MKRQHKLISQQHEEQTVVQQEAQQQSAQEFANADEMLRHDALHTPVPPAIAHRLQESIAQLPPPSKSWWRRFLGSGT